MKPHTILMRRMQGDSSFDGYFGICSGIRYPTAQHLSPKLKTPL
jgi:hypothetical protein